jgi:ATP-dependent helicase/nuclease subunit A
LTKKILNLTVQQNKIVESKEKNLIVSACAGCGKTCLLVEKALKSFNDKKNILILTFSESARREIKERSSNLPVMTFHSFCAKLIRENFYLINDIESDFKIIEEFEEEIIKKKVFDRIFDKKFLLENQVFMDLLVNRFDLDKYRTENILQSVKNIFLDLYDDINVIDNWKIWLNEKISFFYRENQSENIEKNFFYKEIKRYFYLKLENLRKTIIELKKNCLFMENKEFIDLICFQIENEINYINLDKEFSEIKFDLENINFSKLTKPKDIFGYNKIIFDKLKNYRNILKNITKKIREKIFFNKEENIKKVFIDDYLILKNMIRILINVDGKIYKEKIKNNILYFNDLEKLAIKILKTKKIFFDEIFIDEYQDINDVQENILNLLVCNKKFMIGDIKQCIYKFRNSCPELFEDKIKNHSDSFNNLSRFNLTENFRSSKKIVNAINYIFKKLFVLDKEKLISVRNDDNSNINNNNDDVKLFLINCDKDKDKKKIESKFIVYEVKKILNSGIKIENIAILARTKKDIMILSREFEKENIKTCIDKNLILSENKTFVDLIKIIKIILENNFADKKINFNENKKDLENLSEEVINNLEKNFEYIKQNKDNLSVIEIVKFIFKNIMFVCETNDCVEKIIDLIECTEGKRIGRLDDLLIYFKYIKKNNYIKNNQSQNNSIKIITIHNSKGQEFDIVFVSFLGNSFNLSEKNKKILIDKRLGIGLKKSLAYNFIELNKRKEILDEELRILYVAMTRAKNKLFLTGCCDYENESLCKNLEHKNFLEIIFSRINKIDSDKCPIKIIFYDKKKILEKYQNSFFYKKSKNKNKNKNEKKNIKLDIFLNRSPNKISVSQYIYKNYDKRKIISEVFDINYDNSKKYLAVHKDIAMHNILKYIDFNDINNSIENNLNRLVRKNLITYNEINLIDIEDLKFFLNSEIASKMRKSDFLYRSKNFSILLDNTIVYGVIDCYFKYKNKTYVVDYINNYFDNVYNYQKLRIYKNVIEKNYDKKVDFIVVYSFKDSKTIFVNFDL